jgi:CO dehydrogenase/acetyl-CoA synthase epsilon subunit
MSYHRDTRMHAHPTMPRSRNAGVVIRRARRGLLIVGALTLSASVTALFVFMLARRRRRSS